MPFPGYLVKRKKMNGSTFSSFKPMLLLKVVVKSSKYDITIGIQLGGNSLHVNWHVNFRFSPFHLSLNEIGKLL